MIPILGYKSSATDSPRQLDDLVLIGTMFLDKFVIEMKNTEDKYGIYHKKPEFVIGSSVYTPENAS